MNRTQKLIIGWASVVIGLTMVAVTNFTNLGFWVVYLGLVMGVVGMLILTGKGMGSGNVVVTLKRKRIVGWIIVAIGCLVVVAIMIKSDMERAIIFIISLGGYHPPAWAMDLLTDPAFYGGIAFIVVGILVIIRMNKKLKGARVSSSQSLPRA